MQGKKRTTQGGDQMIDCVQHQSDEGTMSGQNGLSAGSVGASVISGETGCLQVHVQFTEENDWQKAWDQKEPKKEDMHSTLMPHCYVLSMWDEDSHDILCRWTNTGERMTGDYRHRASSYCRQTGHSLRQREPFMKCALWTASGDTPPPSRKLSWPWPQGSAHRKLWCLSPISLMSSPWD
jgi:hypothetical protein